MENIILQFLNIYFWVFIVTYVIKSLCLFTNEYKENKKNSIKNGTRNLSILPSVIGWSVFILSIVLT